MPQSAGAIRWLGPVFDLTSHAELGRGLVRGLHRAGVTVAVHMSPDGTGVPLSELCTEPGELLDWMARLHDDRELPTVICGWPVTADGFDFARVHADRHPAIAHAMFTMCETESAHADWVAVLNDLDRVWVPSRFCYDAFERGGVGTDRLRVLRPGVATVANPGPRVVRGPRVPFRFVSIQARDPRKNLDGLIDAFAQAFDGDRSTSLVVKTTPPSEGQRPIVEQVRDHLQRIGATETTIEVHEIHLPRAQVDGLLADADAFVLPSHGEAVGLPYLEALMHSVPVIATNWGGQLDFLDRDTAELIEIDGLVAIDDEVAAQAPHLAGGTWAMPNHRHLVETLRRVRNNHAEALARAERGHHRVAADWTHDAAGRRARDLVADLQAAERLPRRIPVDKPATVVWRGLFYGANSFAVEGRDYVLALDQAGVAIALDPRPGPGPAIALEGHVAERLAQLSVRTTAETWIDVQHAEPRALRPMSGAIASVGRTMFETDGLPEGALDACRSMTEVWLPSDWTAEMFVRHGLPERQAIVIPESIPEPYFDAEPKADLVSSDRTTLLAVFDWQLRKGWDVLIRAYTRAFTASDDVELAILTHSMLRYSRAEIRAAARHQMEQVRSTDLPAVRFLPSPIPESDMPGLFAAADIYVLPTRGEGWGRPFAAAMAANTLAIATDEGGQRHFMDEHNSLLVPSHIVDVPDHAARERPIYGGLRWAEPSEDALVEVLRSAVMGDHRALVVAARARVESFRRENIAEQMSTRFDQLGC